jgi:conjugative transposon TraM protein
MNINFKQPKYILPLILLPFFCLFFFVYQSGFAKKKIVAKQPAGFNGTVADVSPEIKKKQLEDKLDAYRNSYKEGDGLTAVTALPSEKTSNPTYDNNYSDQQKRMLDSINQAMKQKYSQRNTTGQNANAAWYPARKGVSAQDKAMAEALNNLSRRQQGTRAETQPAAKDPMEMFRLQMAYLDSMNKANDPALKAERQKKEALAKAATLKAAEPALPVQKVNTTSADFNTVLPENHPDFIRVVIDENLTGYAGSRIRLRLLDDIQVGRFLIPKDTYLFALISGFSGQRVTLSVKSILFQGKILPVKLEVYDLDGLAGLYVPESAFRDFTKDASTNVIQGIDLQNSSNSFVMGAAGQLFQSTSSAIAGMIRKNKARIKYNSYLYLIDNEALQNATNNH